MGYMHIRNLYADQRILQFREVYALEKIHGTSAHLKWANCALTFSSGGEKHDRFVLLFDQAALRELFAAIGHDAVTVYGEAYGGKQQGQSWRYGPELKFVAFEVQIGETWLDVPNAADVCDKLGLEFVHYRRVPTDLASIDAERDAPSEQARRNGVDGDKPREGVVLRPIMEVRLSNGDRIIAKHKRDEERETKTPRRVVDAAQLEVMQEASRIADEYVTTIRLRHVLDHLGGDVGIERMRDVISAMTEDVVREGSGEIVDSKAARAEIGRRTAMLFKETLKAALQEQAP